MRMESQADNELQILKDDLASGTITNSEYNDAVREIVRDFADYERQGY
jgi:uncharacterized membrane protein